MVSTNYVRNCIEKGAVCPKLMSSYKELEGVVAKLKSLSYEGVDRCCDEDCENYEDCAGDNVECIESEFFWAYIHLLITVEDCTKKLNRACSKCGGKNLLITRLITESDVELKKKALMKAERELAKAEFEIINKKVMND